jgi:AhpD family alkylhydroperoxidase
METDMSTTTKSPWFVETSPEIGKLFEQFYEGCKEKGVLDKKTKELLMAALACVFRCPHCVEEHIQGALDSGASKEEVTEALLIAAVEGAGTQLTWKKEVFMKYLSS